MIEFKEIPRCYSTVNRIINRTNAQNNWRYELGKPKVKLTGKRVQKIIYLCQLFWFIDHENSNMIPEDFVAWPNGPIIPEIYNYWMVYQDGDMCPCPYVKDELSKEEADLINIVVDNTIDISTEAIIDYIQLHDIAWQQAYKGTQCKNSIITKYSIKQYIQKEENQRELFNFIKSETNKCENSRFAKKRIASISTK